MIGWLGGRKILFILTYERFHFSSKIINEINLNKISAQFNYIADASIKWASN